MTTTLPPHRERSATDDCAVPDRSDGDQPAPPRRRPLRLVLGGIALGAALIAVASIGLTRSRDADVARTSATGPVVTPNDVDTTIDPNPADLDELIDGLRRRLEAVPGDHTAWATLGLAYVQQAAATVDPSFYELAEEALDQSLLVEPDANHLALAGRSALASARHEFRDAKIHADAGLEINRYSALLHGALADADVQLGDYDAAFAAIDEMLRLSAGTPSFARASYLYELRGETDIAIAFMEDALDAAPTPNDRAFALVHLGQLAFDQGDPALALDRFNEARREVPDHPAALAGKARAEAALGQTLTAIDHYAELVTTVPEPGYVYEYGRLLESLGRTAEADEQYRVAADIQTLFEVNGVQPDADPILFLAERDDPSRALAAAERAVAERPFLAIHDAHAWALHRSGRHDEALVAIDEALALGTLDASFHFHAGMIHAALGDRDEAVHHLTEALDINPFFDPLDRVVAQRTLSELTEGAPR